VLSDGRVWSVHKKGFLTNSVTPKGYVFIKLWDGGKLQNRRLNILIAEAFVEKPEDWAPNWDAAHLDDNPLNNDYTNIQWQTRS
jgi:hypothetical protein